MGYSPWGHKGSDIIEATEHSSVQETQKYARQGEALSSFRPTG